MNLDWMDDTIDYVYKNNWVYKMICFFMGRKLKFKELYLILERLNEKHLGEEESKKRSLNEILKIYQKQKGELPEGI